MFTLQDPRPTTFNAWYARIGKGVLDRCTGSVLLVLTVPLLAAVAVVVRLALGPGVLFVQQRAGRYGRPFACLKFRTMRPDRRIAARPYAGPDRRSGLPSPDDPRHTVVGTALRRLGLDELPQLVNVLRGEMSLVGPRPELVESAERYVDGERERFAVRPGLTGYWQVTRRSLDVYLRRGAQIDGEYARKVSFANDLRILGRTPHAILFRPAATECRRLPRNKTDSAPY
jgi:exopolysaccharide production protein ExoY